MCSAKCGSEHFITQTKLNHSYISSPYRAVDTLPLGYKTSQLMLYREIIAVSSQIHTKHINILCRQKVELLKVKTGGTYSNHWALKGKISVIKTNQLRLYGEIIAVCSQLHTKHINKLCGQNVELLNVKAGGTYSNHWALWC